jgi:hypothetical protein
VIKEDIALIRVSLKAWRNLAWGFRYGGLYRELEQALQALEALNRVEEELGVKQLRLFEETSE